MSRHPIFDLVPADYCQHPLHAADRDWAESNCYIDVYIGLLHGLGVDVHACLPFTLGVDFEGDQWTFFKPPLSMLRDLYGVDVQELTLWRPLLDHVQEQLARGRLVTPEVDSFYLPDVVGTDYHRAHVKSTVSITYVDAGAKRMHYFHNRGHYTVEGADFDGVFRIGHAPQDDYLPPYCEYMKLDHLRVRPTAELVTLSLAFAREQLSRLPGDNPMARYAERLARDLQWLVTQDASAYHAYVFATLRQCGAAFELAALYLRWLEAHGVAALSVHAEHFQAISRTAKMLVLKLARIQRSGQVRDLSEHLQAMSVQWQAGMQGLAERLKG